MSILTNLNRIVIIGAGPAGVSAALGLLEGRLNVLIIDSRGEIGGQLHQIPSPITNWAASVFENGKEAAESLRDGLERAAQDTLTEGTSLELRLGAVVEKIKRVEQGFELALEGGETINAERLIIAPGYREKPHLLEGKHRGENPFIIHHTSLRQESLADDVPVAIVGGGDSALLKALKLEKDTKKEIYIIHRSAKLRARPDVIEKLKKAKRCHVLLESEVVALTPGKSGSNCRLTVSTRHKNGERVEQNLSVAYMLVKIGYLPNTEFLRDFIKLDNDGHVPVDQDLHPSGLDGRPLPNVFVAGDVLARTTPRLATASGQGMQAASKIIEDCFYR